MVVYTDTTKGLLHEGHHTGPAGGGGLDAYREAAYLKAGDRELIQVGQLFDVAVGLVSPSKGRGTSQLQPSVPTTRTPRSSSHIVAS